MHLLSRCARLQGKFEKKIVFLIIMLNEAWVHCASEALVCYVANSIPYHVKKVESRFGTEVMDVFMHFLT